MTETSSEGDLYEESDDTSGEQGGYEQPGAYTAPDGTTGYSGLQSGGEEPGEEPSSDYEASVGATLAVGFTAVGLAVDGIAAGFEASAAVGQIYMSVEVGVEMLDAIFGD
jgi:hypothetical protein